MRYSVDHLKKISPVWAPKSEEGKAVQDGEICSPMFASIDAFLEGLVLLERCQHTLEDFTKLTGIHKKVRESLGELLEDVEQFLEDQTIGGEAE